MGHMNLSLPDDLIAELRRAVPDRRRSAFVAEAIRDRLALIAQVDAVRETAGAWSSEGRPDPAEDIRKGREDWQGREPRDRKKPGQ